jgi:hypothetical protein
MTKYFCNRRTGNNKKVLEYAKKVDEAISYIENLIYNKLFS